VALAETASMALWKSPPVTLHPFVTQCLWNSISTPAVNLLATVKKLPFLLTAGMSVPLRTEARHSLETAMQSRLKG